MVPKISDIFYFNFFTSLFFPSQVVKRRAIADTSNDDEVSFSRRKQPMRERLGNNMVDSDFIKNKQRNKRYLPWICDFHCLYVMQFFSLCYLTPNYVSWLELYSDIFSFIQTGLKP
jgi:hypothetical protein